MAKIITEKKLKIVIPDGKKKERLDTYLANSIENATRSRVQKLIKAYCVTVNNIFEKPNYKVNPGDLIEVTIPISPRPDVIEPEEIPLDIVYEDEYLLILNKPPGMVVHPSLGHHTGTLVHALLHHTKKLSDLNEPGRPGIIHRIDKDTSGLLVIAKDEWTHSRIAKQFSTHSIKREYWAVCWGIFKDSTGEITGNIARSKKDRKVFSVSTDEGKHAHTFYEVIEEYEFASLVKLRLKTGRTHQIRVHMSFINHPVFGDPTYDGRKIIYGSNLPKIKSRVNNLLEIIPRQALHAKTIGFYHPHKKEVMEFNSELPEDMKKLIANLKYAE
ncbi:MAG: RluA family pseudouridine synthase [Melioribacteraceae bacterium]|nr:RluA family pseudouridine synthase [Melioribacteraceae bacterium]MCF8353130.1 RluA family pseudouridine synthase [Melioribacteraceae bacterium]MCF8392724.1 RluA family pseudouridine synthase [Melioribacteraceae bacterium]MCF8418255.1 RluA family pseudouridine synthase [Melioribacteraceae bacterium]